MWPWDDRGATAVEYALLVALVVVALLGAVQETENAVGDKYDDSVADIESLPGSDGQIDPNALGSSTSTTTSTPPTSTTLDVGPSSTTSSTTTTTPTSSTTSSTVPTSTTLAPRTTVISVTDVSTDQGSRKWRASARVLLRHNQTNVTISGATVTVTFYAANGSTTSVSCTTDSSGSCAATWANRTSVHSPLLATVTGVRATPTWDQVEVSTHLRQP